MTSLASIITNKSVFNELDRCKQLEIIEVLFKINSYNQKSFIDFLKSNINLLETFAYYFHYGGEEITDAIESLIRNLIHNGLNKKPPIEMLTTGFFTK